MCLHVMLLITDCMSFKVSGRVEFYVPLDT